MLRCWELSAYIPRGSQENVESQFGKDEYCFSQWWLALFQERMRCIENGC